MHISSTFPLYCDEANNRKYYYEPPHIYGWLYYDGDRHGMINYVTWRDRLIARMAIPAPITMTMWGDYTSGKGTGNVNVQFRNDSTESLTGRVIIAVTEDSLYYVGPNQDTIHNNVARDYLPDENGTVITIIPGDSVIVTQPFVIDTNWVERSCRIVAWIQSDSAYADSTREVWQGSVATLGELLGVREHNKIIPNNNAIFPTSVTGMIDLPTNRQCRILDISGRSVKLSDMRTGIYFVEIDRKVTHKVVKIQ